MHGFWAVFKREFQSLFSTFTGYVFIASFSSLSILFALQIGQLIESGRADLWSMFQFHPWLYIIFIPLLGIRAWSDEIRAHTLDTLLSLPIPIIQLVLGKYFAGLCVVFLGLVCTIPFWFAINLLGAVDNGAAGAAYFGSILLAGVMLAVANAASVIAKNQIIAFILASVICFALSALGLPIVTQLIGSVLGESVANLITIFSLSDQFYAIARGYISLSGIVFFISTIMVWLSLSAFFVDNKRSSLN